MTKRALVLPLICLAAIIPLTLAVWADDGQEEKVTLDQVPAPVKATILKESAGGEITEIERETKDGKTVYEAEFMLNGQKIEIKIAPDGALLGRDAEDEDDDDLSIDQVPGPARAALLKLAGNSPIVEVEAEKEHGVQVFDAKWVKDGVRHEAAVMADGTLLEIEESIPADQAPAAVRAAIAQRFGGAGKVTVVKKMIVVYEIEAKINGKEKELLVFPTGKIHEEPATGNHDRDDDDDNDDDDDD
ncbi:MAG: PepSY-like domain-containing protein [Planctomycetes bacterium]|nr:PepSY-like domain-containing protein [Planctomycetota bacterium]